MFVEKPFALNCLLTASMQSGSQRPGLGVLFSTFLALDLADLLSVEVSLCDLLEVLSVEDTKVVLTYGAIRINSQGNCIMCCKTLRINGGGGNA